MDFGGRDRHETQHRGIRKDRRKRWREVTEREGAYRRDRWEKRRQETRQKGERRTHELRDRRIKMVVETETKRWDREDREERNENEKR